MPDLPFAVKTLIKTGFLAGGRWVPECESTNTVLLAEDTPTPFLLGTDNQTAGRGRPGKTWVGGPGCLTFSVAVSAADVAKKRDLIDPHDASPVDGVSSLAVGAAVCEAIDRLSTHRHEPAQVKWPNDVLIEGKKVAGVLIETRGDRTVIGVGLNVSGDPPAGLNATTLEAAFGVAPTPAVVLPAVVFRLLDEGLRWDDEVLGYLRGRDALFGRRITVGDASPCEDGQPSSFITTAHGLSSRGELITEDRFLTGGTVGLLEDAA